ncbi:MAG: transposase [Rickettsiaceae bacterium]
MSLVPKQVVNIIARLINYKSILIKELKISQFVIMDNARVHKSQKRKELIEFFSCRIIFLPLHSPDLNSIENFWTDMKRQIEDKISTFDQLYQAPNSFFSLC